MCECPRLDHLCPGLDPGPVQALVSSIMPTCQVPEVKGLAAAPGLAPIELSSWRPGLWV